jgi:ATP-dependent helicase HepA
MQSFVRGQRWLSETQSDLGLGLVEAVEERTVLIVFPATGERRTYTRRDAPLWRAAFAVGEHIRDRDGTSYVVVGTDERGGVIRYRARDATGNESILAETELDAHLRLNRPQQKLLASRLDQDQWFRLRYRCFHGQARWQNTPTRGLVGARISPIPHQLYVAAEVAARPSPRVLLADEVGLGKTIEAGLILHRMLLAGRVRRVLVLVPEPLLHQWLVEMLRRFNLRMALFDRERIAAASDEAAGDNPFHSEQRVLCSLDLLTEQPATARAVLDGDWDLLIVDEAHHLQWSPDGSSLDYDLVEALADQTPAVLLLTATPEQLGRAGHFGRLRLLDPRRFSYYESFLSEETDYAPVAELAARLIDHDPLDPGQAARLDAWLGDTSGLVPRQIVERLLDRHGTGRVLFRNTRAAIHGFPPREAQPSPLPVPDGYPATAWTGADGLYPERLHGPDWTGVDPRVPWLIDTLRRLRPAKVLLIAAHAETVLALRQALKAKAGIQTAVFHEGMEIVERDRAAVFFADPQEGAQVLLCSEIGSEGRNFQFAHHLILFDLPLAADLLEQRIGRLDRIGQTQTIAIHVPYLSPGPQAVIYRWYAEALNAFRATCPAASALDQQLGGRLREALADAGTADALISEATALRKRLNAELEAGRDRLLELHSHRPAASAKLVHAIQTQDLDRALRDWLVALWDAFGVEHEPGPGVSTVIRPGRHMLQEHFPGLPEDGLTVTYDRGDALSHEERAFLTWEHPMVRDAMELIAGSDLGTSVVLLARDARFSTGSLVLEMLYMAECPAPVGLDIGRFLPPTLLRLAVDETGRDRAHDVLHDDLNGHCMTAKRKLARTLIAAKGQIIERMLLDGERLAQTGADQLRASAVERMRQGLDAEIERLQALAAFNPTIRPEEVAQLRDERARLEAALGHIHLRLDALRLVVFA